MENEKKKVDWLITLLPLAIVVALCVIFFVAPDQSNEVLSKVRFFFGDTMGTYYLVIGLGIFLLSIYIACSKYGNIVLGEKDEKPKYSFFACGSVVWLLTYCFTPFPSGLCMQQILTSQKWEVFRIGQVFTQFFIGA